MMFSRMANFRLGRLLGAALALTVVAGCNTDSYAPKAKRPLPAALLSDMQAHGMTKRDPILIRIFKQESTLEIWKQTKTGDYAFLKSYDICKWSGALGPKKKEGDRQAPEGFYVVTPAQMNPNSNYHLSFNLGYPNAYDRAYGRTGSHLMVHGACSSAGCYSMNDEQIQEIYSIAREAFDGGQRAFQVHAYPFRMTPENVAQHLDDPNLPFWKNLKEGYDHFEVTKRIPSVNVCDKRYVFNAQLPAGVSRFEPSGKCPHYEVPQQIATAVASKQAADDTQVRTIVAKLEEDKQRTEERELRREERHEKINTMIAGVLGSDDADKKAGDAEAAVTTAVASTAPAAGGQTAIAYTGSVDATKSSVAKAEAQSGQSGSVSARLTGKDEQTKATEAASATTGEAKPGETAVPAQKPAMAAAGEQAVAEATPAKKDRGGGIKGRFESVFSRIVGSDEAAAKDAATETPAAETAVPVAKPAQ